MDRRAYIHGFFFGTPLSEERCFALRIQPSLIIKLASEFSVHQWHCNEKIIDDLGKMTTPSQGSRTFPMVLPQAMHRENRPPIPIINALEFIGDYGAVTFNAEPNGRVGEDARFSFSCLNLEAKTILLISVG